MNVSPIHGAPAALAALGAPATRMARAVWLAAALLVLGPVHAAGPAAAPGTPGTPAGPAAQDPRVAPVPMLAASRASRAERRRAAAAAAAPAKRIDINGASKKELMTLPGIGEAEADRIVANRPYLSKAELVHKGVLPLGPYLSLKNRIIALQKVKPKPRR